MQTTAFADSTTRAEAIIASDLKRVDELLRERSASRAEVIPFLTYRLLSAGGKRTRARITLESAHLCGYRGDAHIALAAAVEMMHTATLFHDDVVDGADMRRSQPTANATAGNAAAVLIGDFLLGQAFQLMVSTGSMTALEVLSKAAARIAEGEVLQLSMRHDPTVPYETYVEIITAKTATLFSAAAEVGACIAGKPDNVRSSLAAYGLNLGIAFQMIDDVLDYDGDSARTGKELGTDFREQKMTLPVLLAVQAGKTSSAPVARENETGEADKTGETEDEFWRRAFSPGEQRDGDFDNAVRILRERNAIAQTREAALHYANLSQQALGDLPSSEWTQQVQRNLINVSAVRTK